MYNRKASYAHTPGSDSYWLRASSCQLAARVKHARNRVTAAAAIPASVCNSPARPCVAPSSCTTRRRLSNNTSVWRTLALGELFTVRWRRIDCVQRTWLPLVGADPENNYQVPAGTGIQLYVLYHILVANPVPPVTVCNPGSDLPNTPSAGGRVA